ncbi:hypothetical protein K438DRAFT_1765047 [Mycena galopus ATCC 62051]|nr:hypothetical protein K438DRAFT_1765047 [Mycena galopus ATCC 62051]
MPAERNASRKMLKALASESESIPTGRRSPNQFFCYRSWALKKGLFRAITTSQTELSKLIANHWGNMTLKNDGRSLRWPGGWHVNQHRRTEFKEIIINSKESASKKGSQRALSHGGSWSPGFNLRSTLDTADDVERAAGTKYCTVEEEDELMKQYLNLDEFTE